MYRKVSAWLDLWTRHLSGHYFLILLFSGWSLFSGRLSLWRQRLRLTRSLVTVFQRERERERDVLSALISNLKTYMALGVSYVYPKWLLAPKEIRHAGQTCSYLSPTLRLKKAHAQKFSQAEVGVGWCQRQEEGVLDRQGHVVTN